LGGRAGEEVGVDVTGGDRRRTGGPETDDERAVVVLPGIAGVKLGEQLPAGGTGRVLRTLGTEAGGAELVVHLDRLGHRLLHGEGLHGLGMGRGTDHHDGQQDPVHERSSGCQSLTCTVTTADCPARSTMPVGTPSSAIRTGMRWATFTKLPVALSGGKREKRAPVPPERLSTLPRTVSP